MKARAANTEAGVRRPSSWCRSSQSEEVGKTLPKRAHSGSLSWVCCVLTVNVLRFCFYMLSQNMILWQVFPEIKVFAALRFAEGGTEKMFSFVFKNRTEKPDNHWVEVPNSAQQETGKPIISRSTKKVWAYTDHLKKYFMWIIPWHTTGMLCDQNNTFLTLAIQGFGL